jgi:arylsulfatase A-like enzyme
VDDLKPLIGAYGAPLVKTPHIDALARHGLLFERAYVQQAVCSPSRSSLMTGRRPDTTRVWDLQTHFRIALPDVVTLSQHFKEHGYHAQGIGKIYHGGLDDPRSWSVPHATPKAPLYGPALQAELDRDRAAAVAAGEKVSEEPLERDPKTGLVLRVSNVRRRIYGPAWEAADVGDDHFTDGQTATRAIELLGQLGSQAKGKDASTTPSQGEGKGAPQGRPFFLAVGFQRPHLPFVAPKKYFDLYPPDRIPLAGNPDAPRDAPAIALHSSGELRTYKGIPAKGPLPPRDARDLVRAYYAAVSYLDAQVGRLLGALDAQGLRDDTIVVLWGDHGWHLGDHGMWCKHSNFESATRAPLIVAAPGMKAAGKKTRALVEFVDIYPTLVDLARLPMPTGLEGTSFAPLLERPDRPWKTGAFSQYPRGDAMGYALRTDRYRYVEWRGKSGAVLGRELYDHRDDPDEDRNLAGRADAKATVDDLARQLARGWRGALPGRT